MDAIKKDNWISLKRELARLFFIGFGVFLFVLFFQPFPLTSLEYNDRLLYVTGFGFITFILSFIVLVLIQLLFTKWFKQNQWDTMPPLFLNICLLFLTIIAYCFYIRYVGDTYLSNYILFKIFLVCVLPIIILGILYKNKSLELIIETLQKQNKTYLEKIEETGKDADDEIIEIISEDKKENFSVKYKDIIAVKSADNYIKLYYNDLGSVEMKLIRNTLKNIEELLTNKWEFIRCHRTSLVNIKHSGKLIKNYSGYSLKMNGLEEDIAISRQYLILIKEAISNK